MYWRFEIIKVTNTDTFSTSNSIANTYSINGTLSSPPVNTILKYYSRNSSSFGYGTVSNRDITVSAGTDKIEVNGLTSLEVSYGSCIPGDSGGPFFQETSSDVNYCGVLHGYGTDNPGYLRVYFTPYTYISGTGFRLERVKYRIDRKQFTWIFARISMASCGLRAAARAGAIFRRDSAHIRLCTAASAVGGMMEP